MISEEIQDVLTPTKSALEKEIKSITEKQFFGTKVVKAALLKV